MTKHKRRMGCFFLLSILGVCSILYLRHWFNGEQYKVNIKSDPAFEALAWKYWDSEHNVNQVKAEIYNTLSQIFPLGISEDTLKEKLSTTFRSKAINVASTAQRNQFGLAYSVDITHHYNITTSIEVRGLFYLTDQKLSDVSVYINTSNL